MQLVKLVVKNWKGIQSSTLEFDKGITVVGGPNECGKTSLRFALRAALLMPAGERNEKKKLEQFRPWGTNLNPKVSLEFIVGGHKCLVEKEFLRTKNWASLQVDGKLVAEDSEVQPKIHALMTDSLEWVDVLWGIQGEIAMDKAAPDSVKAKLATAAAATVSQPVAHLETLIDEEFKKYWTPTGRPKEIVQGVRDAEMEAEKEVAKLKNELAELNKRTDELSRERVRLTELRAKNEETEQAWSKANASLGAWETCRRLQSEATAAEESLKGLDKWITNWRQTSDRVHELWPKSKEWSEKLRQVREKTGKAPQRDECNSISSKMQYLKLLLASRQIAEAEAIFVPTKEELQAFKVIEEKLRELAANLKSGELRAKLTPEQALSVELTVDGKLPQRIPLSLNTDENFSAEREFELHIPGVARLQVESGNPSVIEDMEARDSNKAKLDAFLEKWKSSTLSELQERFTKKEVQLKQFGKVDPKQLAQARALVVDAVELDELSTQRIQEILESLPQSLQDAESAWKKANEIHAQSTIEEKQLLEKNVEQEFQNVLVNLQEYWRSAPIEKSDDSIVPESVSEGWLSSLEKHSKAAASLRDARAKELAERQAKLSVPEGAEVTAEKIAELQELKKKQSAEIDAISAAVNQAAGAINAMGDLYARYVAAEERKAKAELEKSRLEVDAYAILGIQKAFVEAREALQADVVAPLQDRVGERFTQLTSGFYDRVKFDKTLKLDTVATASVDSINLEEISFGTREQLSLLSRICLAELLSEASERQIVILDDNLVHTDEIRMELACRLLEKAASQIQIVIFTCHPERYQQLAEKKEIAISARGA